MYYTLPAIYCQPLNNKFLVQREDEVPDSHNIIAIALEGLPLRQTALVKLGGKVNLRCGEPLRKPAINTVERKHILCERHFKSFV